MKRPIMTLILVGLLTACTTTVRPVATNVVTSNAIWFSTIRGERLEDGAEPTTPYQWQVGQDGHGQFAVLRNPFPDAPSNPPRMIAYHFQLSMDELQRFADLIQQVRTALDNPPDNPHGVRCPIMNITVDSIGWDSSHAASTYTERMYAEGMYHEGMDVFDCPEPRIVATLNRALNILRVAARLPTARSR